MSVYKLQPNEIQFTINTPTPNSDTFVSCILSTPEDGKKGTLRAGMLMHGIGAHKNTCYQSKLARKLSKEQGMFLVRFDFRNCGDSSKTKEQGRTLQNDIEDMNAVYEWLSNGGYKGRKLFVDSLIGHSRGVVDVFNWQLSNPDKFVMNLVACAGRYIGNGLHESIKADQPDFEKRGGHVIQGFQDGQYKDVWVPLAETKSLTELHMHTVEKINGDTDTLCVYGSRENVIPLEDAAHYTNSLRERNTLILIPGADHCFRGVDRVAEEEWKTCGHPIIEKLGIIDYTADVAEKVADWMSVGSMNRRFYAKHRNIHKYLPRWKTVDGVINFRDIGGWATKKNQTVRFGHIFRSGMMDGITEAGVSAMQNLGIKKVFRISLPSWTEQSDNGADFAAHGIAVEDVICDSAFEDTFMDLTATLVLGGEHTEAFHQALLEKYVPLCRPIFLHLRDEPASAFLMSSSLGKDYTSIVVALLLLLVGVDPLIIAQEYMLSHNEVQTVENFHRFTGFSGNASVAGQQQPLQKRVFKKGDVDRLLDSTSTLMLQTLATFEQKYTTAVRYFKEELGFNDSDISSIVSHLVL